MFQHTQQMCDLPECIWPQKTLTAFSLKDWTRRGVASSLFQNHSLLLLCAWPSLPLLPQPQLKISPDADTAKECSAPAAKLIILAPAAEALLLEQ